MGLPFSNNNNPPLPPPPDAGPDPDLSSQKGFVYRFYEDCYWRNTYHSAESVITLPQKAEVPYAKLVE
jgi:hypothetical protein